MRIRKTRSTGWLGPMVVLPAAVALTLSAGVCAHVAAQQEAPMGAKQEAMMKKLEDLAPARGFLDAHDGVAPQPLFGGPLKVTIRQTSGGVFVALPDNRELDPDVFGTPDLPRAYGGTPGINGVPPMARGEEGGKYTTMTMKSPFGDAHAALPDGNLDVELLDATAMDASSTSDQVHFKASWKDKGGNTYEVDCCGKVLAHGLEYPTFGGVVTNHLLHGFTRLGTALMPTEYVYAAFWGMGTVKRNGETLDQPRLVHGMLTEYVRTEGYRLAEDAQVTPTRMQFHLMVPPFQPDPQTGHFDQRPVKTGFTLPNGMALPFWHVMFENLSVSAERQAAGR